MREKTIKTPLGDLAFYFQENSNSLISALILHGWGESSAWYTELASKLYQLGWNIVIPDLRGHGKSFGRRGHIRAWSDYFDDIEQVMKEFPDQNWIFFGQSMGALVTLRYLQSRPADSILGAVLSSLPFGVHMNLPNSLRPLMKFLSRWIPWLPIKYKLPKQLKDSNKNLIREKPQKHYGHRIVTPRWMSEFEKNMMLAQNEKSPDLPFLLLLGEKDTIIHPEKLIEFTVKNPHCVLKVYSGLGHKLFQESNHEKIYPDILEWASKLAGGRENRRRNTPKPKV